MLELKSKNGDKMVESNDDIEFSERDLALIEALRKVKKKKRRKQKNFQSRTFRRRTGSRRCLTNTSSARTVQRKSCRLPFTTITNVSLHRRTEISRSKNPTC